MHTARLLIIGFDGLDYDLLHRYLEEMPHLGELASGGTLARMSSIHPPITPGAWTSICSGVNPGRSGVLNFFVRRDYSFVPVALQPTPVKALWDFSGEQQVSCGIVNIPWPGPLPEGLCFGISGRFTALEVTPPSVKDQVVRMGYRADVHHPSEFSRLQGFLRFTFEQAQACTRVAIHMIETFRPEICMVVYNLPDIALHAMLNERMIRRVYKEIDRIAGELIPYGVQHVVVSDHGIDIAKRPVFYLGEWLVREGHLKLAPQPARLSSRERAGFFLRRVMHRLGLQALKKGLPQFLRKLLPPGIQYPAFLPVDYARSRAFLGPGEFGDLFLNIRGRESQGLLEPDGSEAFLDELAESLIQTTGTGARAPICLSPTARVYEGDLLHLLPDAVVTDYGSWHLEPGLYPQGPLGPEDIKHEHNQGGVFLFPGSSSRAIQTTDPVRLVDVLPTSLMLAGLRIPEGLDGRSLLEVPDGAALPLYSTPLTLSREGPKEPSREEEEEILERLRKLGYL